MGFTALAIATIVHTTLTPGPAPKIMTVTFPVIIEDESKAQRAEDDDNDVGIILPLTQIIS